MTEDEEPEVEEEEEVVEHPLFPKVPASVRLSYRRLSSSGELSWHSKTSGEADKPARQQTAGSQTEMTGAAVAELEKQLSQLELRNSAKLLEIGQLVKQVFNLKQELSSMQPIRGKVERLQSQNSVLKEKTQDVRRENDQLVDKIQQLQQRLSSEVRVSVSEWEEDGEEEAPVFLSPSPLPNQQAEEKRFEEAAEKIMRLEQRIMCLQKANNLNSCATCRPLRGHVMKIERQLLSLVQERKGQLEELYDLKQEALASAVSEKDAHLAWLEVTGDGEHNFHTRESCDRLRRERRQLLGRMKEESEVRATLLSRLDQNTTSLFTGPTKISTLGALGESLAEAESPGLQSTSSLQSASTGPEGEPGEEDRQSNHSC